MKKIVYILCATVFILSCKDTTDDGPIIADGQDPTTGVRLIFPYEDELCNEGTNLTPTESTVYFEWESNNNAENYTLTIENLASGDITQYETEDFIIPVTIQRAIAFRWFVTYNYQNDAKQSAIWNFYNAGSGVQTYAPFPTEIISPNMAQNIPSTSSVMLQWEGSDVDDDIVGYDVYFSTSNLPDLNTSDTSANQLSVSVNSGNIYYWKVVTKDAEGNSSESEVFQFRILD